MVHIKKKKNLKKIKRNIWITGPLKIKQQDPCPSPNLPHFCKKHHLHALVQAKNLGATQAFFLSPIFCIPSPVYPLSLSTPIHPPCPHSAPGTILSHPAPDSSRLSLLCPLQSILRAVAKQNDSTQDYISCFTH